MLEDNTLTALPTSILSLLTSHVVGLSFAQGALTSWCVELDNSTTAATATATSTLRSLNLSGCPLNSPPYFSSRHLSSLLVLDLSFTEVPDFQSLEFSQLVNLRRLALEDCSLETLHSDDGISSPLQSLVALEYLNISDNDLSNMDDVHPALSYVAATLLELDARENELQENLGRNKYNQFMLTDVSVARLEKSGVWCHCFEL